MKIHRNLSLRFAAVVVLTVGLVGCGGDSKSSPHDGHTATQASEVPFDRAFIDGMVPHHQSAIAMAQAAKDAGLSNPDLVAIAKNIASSQQREINQMRNWRKEWFGSSAIDPNGADPLGLTMEQMGMQHVSTQFSDVGDLDAAFAEMMIDHHKGAIRMAKLAQKKGQHAETRNLADEIIEAQKREIRTMEEHTGEMHH